MSSEYSITRPEFKGAIPNPKLKDFHDVVSDQWGSFVHFLILETPLNIVTHNRELFTEQDKNVTRRYWDLFWSVPIIYRDSKVSFHDHINHKLNNAIALRIFVVEQENGFLSQYGAELGIAGCYPPDGDRLYTDVWTESEVTPKDQEGLPVPRFYCSKLAAKLVWRSRQIIAFQSLIDSIDLP